MGKEFSYKEEYDKKTGSFHVVNSDGCDWCDGVGVNPNGCFCGECDMICKEECSARMTSRYIDEETRDILLSAVHMTDLEDTIQRILDETPTADVAPVIHAHWIEKEESINAALPNNRWLICSHCRTKFNPVFMSACCGFVVSKFPECPICGAKMEVEDNND